MSKRDATVRSTRASELEFASSTIPHDILVTFLYSDTTYTFATQTVTNRSEVASMISVINSILPELLGSMKDSIELEGYNSRIFHEFALKVATLDKFSVSKEVLIRWSGPREIIGPMTSCLAAKLIVTSSDRIVGLQTCWVQRGFRGKIAKNIIAA